MFAAGWKAVRGAGPQRLVITALLILAAVLLARFSWVLPFTDTAERALFDYRSFVLAERVEQDDRVLIVAYDDQTLISLQKRSPLDRGLLARALRNLDGMGARAIGIDILFDQPQAEDGELIETLRSMQTPVSVAYAEMATNELDIVYDQQVYLEEFMAQLEGSTSRPASIRLAESQGVTRLWPDIVPGLPPLIGRAMIASAGEEEARTFPNYEGAIRYRVPATVDRPVFTTLQIDLFANDDLLAIPEVREPLAEQVRGAYVLVGGDIIDYDRALTPYSRFDSPATESGARDVRPPGIEIHAETIAQMLDGARLKQVAPAALWAFAILVVIAGALTALLELKAIRFIPLLLLQLALFIGLPFWLHSQGVDTHGFPAIGPALAWGLAVAAVTSAARASTAVERKFAQNALGKYLPREMASEIIEKPELLALHGEKKEIYVLFSDLEGFTKMSHAITPEQVAILLNRYLEMLSQVILDHGGVIDKFIGDAVVAFWGAPIAREDDATRAAKAGYAVWRAGEDFREWVATEFPDLPKVGKTRVGLHFGEAVVGNFGGDTRIQYTALGDSMNTAARLESGNKAFRTSVMASGDFASRSGLDFWRRMGAVVLSGRASAVDLYEPAPEFPAADRAELNEAVPMLATDREHAIARIEAVAAKHPDDTGLQALVERSRDLDAEGAHVMRSK